ncbi:MAG: hypothetical protein HeimC3_23600 [Candidatus Heimdallarchaeota archaeon LC_3]|nr:MAG: hypothetical protein HeimC3_23600 [Candidatus Heimdallarchaeota archaeon LC_3]
MNDHLAEDKVFRHIYSYKDIGQENIDYCCQLRIIEFLDKLEYLNLSNNDNHNRNYIEEFGLIFFFFTELKLLKTLIIKNTNLDLSNLYSPRQFYYPNLKNLILDGNQTLMSEKYYNDFTEEYDNFSGDGIITFNEGDEFSHVRDLFKAYEDEEITLRLSDDEIEFLMQDQGVLIKLYEKPLTVDGLNLNGQSGYVLSRESDRILSIMKLFSNLVVISLATNEFTEFPYDFSKFHPKLHNIVISENKIKEIPDWILNLKKLQSLDIALNNIDENSVVVKKLQEKGIELTLEYDI